MIESFIFVLCSLGVLSVRNFHNARYIILAIILFVLFFAAIRGDVGTDSQAYVILYRKEDEMSSLSNANIFFKFFYLLRPYLDFSHTITLITALCQGILFYFIARDRRYTTFLIIYFPYFLITYSFNQIRQGLADLFMVTTFAFHLFSSTNIIPTFLVALIHPVSGGVRMLLGGFLENNRSKPLIIYLSFLLLPLLFTVIFFSFTNILIQRYYDYFSGHPDGLGEFNLYPYFYLKSLILIILLSYCTSGKNKAYKFSFFYILCILTTSFFPIANRIFDSLFIGLMAFYASKDRFGTNIPSRVLIYAVIIGIIGTLRFMWAGVGLDGECAKWLPYESFFADSKCN
jgi:hypothetical protein